MLESVRSRSGPGEDPERESVVVPAIGTASSVYCLRSLSRRGVHTIAASEQDSPPAFWSRHCDETESLPSFRDDVVAYKNGLLALARRPDVRAITPLREIDVYVLARYRDEFEEHLRHVWPTTEMLRITHDRVSLMDAAERAGVDVAETKVLGDVEDWGRDWIVKPRYAVLVDEYVDEYAPSDYGAGVNTLYFEPGDEPDAERVREDMGHEPIAQERVSGEEYAFWAMYDRGEALATCQKVQTRSVTYAGGSSVYRETVSIPALREAGKALLDHLDWHGPGCVQFIRDDETGEFKLIEVNPRLWGSVTCAIHAGRDFPYYYWQLATGEPVEVDEAYEVGVGTHQLSGEAVHLYNVLAHDNPVVDPPRFSTRAWEIAKSLYDQPNFDYLSREDPGPFLRECLNNADKFTGRLRDALTVGSDGVSVPSSASR
ncbi:ATP-grasp domain-containing protein [Halorussus sp. AFM4]|uniref:carboxylate--amine ligase n=1 Tax=Halorussus sp. AFM4 TaxID=3421651 RepID=UPI003EB92D0F